MIPRSASTQSWLAQLPWWKVVGAAGLVGVAATGVLVARGERQRRAYSPDEIRERLQARYAEVEAGGPASATSPTPATAENRD